MSTIPSNRIEKRKLGSIETSFSLLHDHCHGTGTLVVAFGVDAPLNAKLIKMTFNLLYLCYPSLSGAIYLSHDEYFLELTTQFEDIPITTLEREDKIHWQRVVELLANTTLETKKFLWRAYVLHDKNHTDRGLEIIFNIHHAITDGISLLKMARQFVEIYINLLQGNSVQLLPSSILPPVESLLDKALFPPQETTHTQPMQYTPLPYQAQASMAQRITKSIYHIVDQEFNSAIVRSCRQQDISINAAFNAALLLALQSMLDKTVNFYLSTPLNLLKFCNKEFSESSMGCNLGFIRSAHENIDQNCNFWALAKLYKHQITQDIPKALAIAENNALLSNAQLYEFLDIANIYKYQHFRLGGYITNKGADTNPHLSKLMTPQFYYVCPNNNWGQIGISISIASINRQSYLTFNYTYPLTQDDWARTFVNKYISILKSNCNP